MSQITFSVITPNSLFFGRRFFCRVFDLPFFQRRFVRTHCWCYRLCIAQFKFLCASIHLVISYYITFTYAESPVLRRLLVDFLFRHTEVVSLETLRGHFFWGTRHFYWIFCQKNYDFPEKGTSERFWRYSIRMTSFFYRSSESLRLEDSKTIVEKCTKKKIIFLKESNYYDGNSTKCSLYKSFRTRF